MAPEKIWFVLADDGETWLGPYEQPEFQEGEWQPYVRSDVAEQRIEELTAIVDDHGVTLEDLIEALSGPLAFELLSEHLADAMKGASSD